MGTITGFGSLILNDDRVFRMTTQTSITLNDSNLTEAELRQRGLGVVARVEIGEDVNDDFSSGTVRSIQAETALKGPVTGTNPLEVFEQSVVVTGNTVLANIPGNNLASLRLGDIPEVSGHNNTRSTLQATRVEFIAGGSPTWKLTGYVDSVVPGVQLTIGAQQVSVEGVTPRDCSGRLSNGDFVEIQANPDPGFPPGQTLDTVTDVECKTPGLRVPADSTAGTLKAQVEGLVTQMFSPFDFIVAGQRVQTNAATQYENGGPEDIEIPALLEAEGLLNAVSGILIARKISFRLARVRIEAPVEPKDVIIGQPVTLLGIPTYGSALTADEDGILSAGLQTSRQMEIRGFVDRSGFVFATRIRYLGTPDRTDVRLRGPVEGIANPMFEILGVAVDTTSASAILDANKNPISATTFSGSITLGSMVQVEDGTYAEARTRS